MEGSIIGSFRKFYNQVKEIIEMFERIGISILSPKQSIVLDTKQEFVILKSDNSELIPIEIQLIALHRILRSSFVYVWNPDGYVGLTTCYEIGRIVERQIPLFFKELPKDLPLFLPENSIWEPIELVDYISKNQKLPDVYGSMTTYYARKLHMELLGNDYYE